MLEFLLLVIHWLGLYAHFGKSSQVFPCASWSGLLVCQRDCFCDTNHPIIRKLHREGSKRKQTRLIGTNHKVKRNSIDSSKQAKKKQSKLRSCFCMTMCEMKLFYLTNPKRNLTTGGCGRGARCRWCGGS